MGLWRRLWQRQYNMGRDLDPAIDCPSRKRDENPGRSDFAGWLAEDGSIPTFANAIHDWKRRRLGTKFIQNQNRKPRARRPGFSGETSAAGLDGAHDSSCFDGGHGDAGVNN
jgi:hypothetical protein